jgi:hypothetical protein
VGPDGDVKKISWIVLILAAALSAQTVSLTGKVSDNAGAPLAGVVVQIFAGQMKATTAGDGTYSLTGQIGTAIQALPGGKSIQVIQYNGGRLFIHSSSPSAMSIKLYDTRGALVAGIFQGQVKQGVTEIPFALDKYGHETLWMHVETETGTTTYKIVAGALSPSVQLDRVASKGSHALGKAAATPLDWIQAAKTGYQSHIEAIASYTGVINITLAAPTAPDFGPNVKIFDPGMAMSAITSGMSFSTGEFSSNRVAWFFKPGSYTLNITTNYYIQAYGLGVSPESTLVTGAVQNTAGGLTAFWRGAEGFTVNGNDTWAVSQADPFRRMHIKGTLALSNGGASGGFISDSKIDGAMNPGAQQQFYFRNNTMNGWSGGNWNMLFQGCDNPPKVTWPTGAVSVVEKVPLVREKPYVIFEGGKYSVFVPAWRTNSQGTSWYNTTPAGERLPIDQFYIAQSGTDNATTINAALAQGKNLLLTPGIYPVNATILVQRPNTVVLGLGMATLKPQNGVVAMKAEDAPGIIISNILFDAGTVQSPCLLQVGDSGSTSDNRANPTIISDIFGRIGGGGSAQAKAHVIMNSNHAILDHCWLWRADHGSGAGWTSNPCNNGLVVNGSNCITYGQMVEHNQQHNTVWNGNNGQMYFYQNELPYDVPNQAAFKDGGKNGWSALFVGPSVTKFAGYSLGIYSFFNRGFVEESNAIETPRLPGIEIHHVVTFSLGSDQGQITHAVNDTGATAKWTATPMIRFGDYTGH